MSKLRVYELAKELEIESKVLVTRLKSEGFKVASHQSTLSADEADNVRKLFGGGAARPAATAGAGAVVRKKAAAGGDAGGGASKPKVIIRRRKAAAPVEPAPESEESEESTSAAAPVTTIRKKAGEGDEAGQVVSKAPEAPAEAKSTEESTTAEAPQSAKEALEAAFKAPTEEAEPAAEASPAAEPAEEAPAEAPAAAAAEEAPAEEEAAKPARRKAVEGGAKIVRRATAEEVEELENANKKRSAGRKEDSRGTRVTGLGLLQNRVTNEKDAADGPPPEEDQWSGRRSRGATGRGADEGKKESESEAAAAARVKKTRRANSSYNMRSLLDQTVKTDDDVGPYVGHGGGQRQVYTPSPAARRRDLKRRKDLKKTQITVPKAEKRIVKMGDTITVGDLAKQLATKAPELIKKLMAQGVMATINQEVDFDTATLIASEYKFEVKSTLQSVDDILGKTERPEGATVATRPPIVTVMGHVDHGKTSILDAIRKANVVSGEAGGITQHIGAYTVDHNDNKITFLDTPGHEAFSTMRARGAKVTDIVVLVVAADDGVMPQTVEAINHAKAAEVPLIVAVNKIDKPNTNVDRVYTELTEHGVQSEEWGGDTQFVKCSAIEGTGLDELLDNIQLLSEVLELKATAEGQAEGVVIEGHLDKGRGPVATIVVQEGTLNVGDFIVAGQQIGRVRAMHNHLGQEERLAGPSQPVEIIGLGGVPLAGDQFNIVEDEKTARSVADWRADNTARSAAEKSSAASLEDLLARAKEADALEVPLIIKGDTQGSVEAVAESIMKLNTERVKNNVVHSAVGGVSESDITLAEATGAVILAFNVRAARGLDMTAEKQGVIIRYFSIIYDLVDSVKAIMVGKLPPIINEVVQGHAEVRKPISVPKIGTVAGSAVVDGKITRNAHCRLIRDDIVIYEGKLSSLRRFKDDVKEVQTGYECGISIEGYNDIKEGDVIEAFVLEEEAATL